VTKKRDPQIPRKDLETAMQKRQTTQTYKTDLQKRPTDPTKRPRKRHTKETNNGDIQKRPTNETHTSHKKNPKNKMQKGHTTRPELPQYYCILMSVT